MKYDLSTINRERLEKLPTAKIAGSYHLQQDPGNGCYGDPPGYPTYFTKNVYTPAGNTPPRGPTLILLGLVIESAGDSFTTWEAHKAKRDALHRELYIPLPEDHPRVQAWISSHYQYSKHCYYDPSGTRRGYTGIWPVPSYELKHFHDDPRFSDERRTKEKAAIEQANSEIIEARRKLVYPDNHKAVRRIREFYPEHQPCLDLIENPPQRYPGDWWGRYATRPTPEECKPVEKIYNYRHPSSGTWCQFCGWYAEAA